MCLLSYSHAQVMRNDRGVSSVFIQLETQSKNMCQEARFSCRRRLKSGES
jgi:hypothetical protein